MGLFILDAAYARGWSDLDAGEHEIYGREREEKLPLRLFFAQREKWENHDALHVLWLWAYKDYPLYRSHTVFPFYYDLSSKVDNRYLLFTPVYRREMDGKSMDQSVLWLAWWGNDTDADTSYHSLIPLYYYSRDGENSFGAYLMPLIWRKTAPGRSSLLVLPLFYTSHSETGSSIASPFYISQTEPEKELHALIPLYLSYRVKDYALHVNLSGISLSEEKLTNSPVSAEINSERLMVDWDLGWFYNLFRISSRHTVRLSENPPLAKPLSTTDTPPAISHKRLRTRADSENFFGLYMLFGVSAYERSNDASGGYRHFRLLPLSWLTWDTKSDNGVDFLLCGTLYPGCSLCPRLV